MFNSVIGKTCGAAQCTTHSIKLDNEMTLSGIPEDINPSKAKDIVERWLSGIAAFEVPSSLVCNLDCKYCYIREKWLKNTHVSVQEIDHIVKTAWDKLFFYNKHEQKHISAWGAEPCMNLDTLEYLVDFCIDKKANLNTSTNGTIMASLPVLEKAFKSGVLTDLQVSLDGPAYIQNEYRPYLSKTGQTFNSVVEFLKALSDIQYDLKIDKRLYNLCSTLYLNEKTPRYYEDCIDFFTEPNTVFECHSMPMRVENHVMYGPEHVAIFEETMRRGADRLIEKSKEYGAPYMDHYTHGLFFDKSRTMGCANCSAMRSQLAVDIDGLIYMCHGPITTTSIKPYCVLGSLEHMFFDFKAIITNLDMFRCNHISSAICASCDLRNNGITGSICGACPPSNLSLDSMPMFYDHYRCLAYQKALPHWKRVYDEAWAGAQNG